MLPDPLPPWRRSYGAGAAAVGEYRFAFVVPIAVNAFRAPVRQGHPIGAGVEQTLLFFVKLLPRN